jgi:hypothetical protein
MQIMPYMSSINITVYLIILQVTTSSLPSPVTTKRPPSDPTGISASESFRYHTKPQVDVSTALFLQQYC